MPDLDYVVAVLPILVVELSVLIAPHVAIGIAWRIWALSPASVQVPRLQRILQILGLLVCSLNIAIFWAFVIWMRFHRTDLSWWELRDKVEWVCDFLIVLAILAGIFGKGRTRRAIPVAATLFWPIWLVFHIGVL
jgi:hypothetical protein